MTNGFLNHFQERLWILHNSLFKMTMKNQGFKVVATNVMA